MENMRNKKMKSIITEKNAEEIINRFYTDYNIIPQNNENNDGTEKYMNNNGNYIKLGTGVDNRGAVEARLTIKVL